MDDESPRYWLWATIGLGAGLMLALLMVISGTPSCGCNPSVRTVESDLSTMPELPNKVDKEKLANAQRGLYLATIAGCAACHTPTDPLTGPSHADGLVGGVLLRSKVFGTLYSANLTPAVSGIGDTEGDYTRLRHALRGGMSTHANTMHPAAMPWHLIGRADTEELDCIFAYLEYAKAIARAVPERGAPGKEEPPGVWIGLGKVVAREK